MQIGILGTGMVGQELARVLSLGGHAVMIGTRDVQATLGRVTPLGFSEPYGLWQVKHPEVQLGTFAQAAAHGEVLINATSGTGSLTALEAAGEAVLADKLMLDIANPLDFSQGMPPSLGVLNTDSLGELIQRRFPRLRVVKTLNTMNVSLMAQPSSLQDGDHTVFISGDDAGARAEVRAHLRDWFGWREDRIFDLGALETARGTEMLLPLWLRVYFQLGNTPFQFKLVH